MDLQHSRFAQLIGRCQSCGTPIVGIRVNGIETEVDATPSPDGHLQIRDTGGDTPIAVALTPAQRFGKQNTLHRTHRATCPKPRRHR